ncbi:hypothetical protein [Pontiella agarivorans]|uniref:Histidine kinase n=1 Tax=Pontiella agarivorans TaxID=3038953 RepID=A0ABU5N212_9BACT|nr:hypothetical protein [Pontiella agarivorans]MDZ8120443.1 hypothetical protein [Pontiella agarivorans]
MNRIIRLATAVAALIAYLATLRFILPPDQPYFILGIGMVALITWLLGTIPGIIALGALIPLTHLVYQQFTVSASYVHFASSPAYLGLQLALALGIGHMRREKMRLQKIATELLESNAHLQDVLSQVQELGGVHNLCSGCKKIQDDSGVWQSIDRFLKSKTKMKFSHGMCPDCADKFRSPPHSTSS